MTQPEVRYADVGGADVAYQVVGDGDVVYLGTPGLAQNLEVLWEDPHAERLIRRHAEFSRFIWFDKRGTGLSSGQVPTSFAERIEDMRGVLDAEGIERAVIGGYSDGGTMSALFAATFPERTAGLVLASTLPCGTWREDLPWRPTAERLASVGKAWSASWGKGRFTVDALAPSMTDDDSYVAWMGRYERHSASPRTLEDLLRLLGEIDIRAILRNIQVPTLVLSRRDDRSVDPRDAEYLAAAIPHSRLVILPGGDHLPWIGDQDSLVDEIEQFVTGKRPTVAADRVLTTVMFTDIVGSTAMALNMGDTAWRRLLDEHDAVTQQVVVQHGGRLVKSTGDGTMATFEIPSRAVSCAVECSERLAKLGVELRAGVHTGEVERRNDDIGGIGVHIAARIMQFGDGRSVLVSSTVKELAVGSGLWFEELGPRHLRGIGEWTIYRVPVVR